MKSDSDCTIDFTRYSASDQLPQGYKDTERYQISDFWFEIFEVKLEVRDVSFHNTNFLHYKLALGARLPTRDHQPSFFRESARGRTRDTNDRKRIKTARTAYEHK